MAFMTRHHSWLRVFLSCLLSALLPTAPVMLSLVPDGLRCEENDPTDSSEEVEVDEVTLSESNSLQRHSRREQTSVRRLLLTLRCAGSHHASRCAHLPTVGQTSLWGRCAPLHC